MGEKTGIEWAHHTLRQLGEGEDRMEAQEVHFKHEDGSWMVVSEEDKGASFNGVSLLHDDQTILHLAKNIAALRSMLVGTVRRFKEEETARKAADATVAELRLNLQRSQDTVSMWVEKTEKAEDALAREKTKQKRAGRRE